MSPSLRVFGVGLALTIIIDATMVRIVLVPAAMKLMGEWSWCAPAPLRHLPRPVRPSRTALDHGRADQHGRGTGCRSRTRDRRRLNKSQPTWLSVACPGATSEGPQATRQGSPPTTFGTAAEIADTRRRPRRARCCRPGRSRQLGPARSCGTQRRGATGRCRPSNREHGHRGLHRGHPQCGISPRRRDTDVGNPKPPPGRVRRWLGQRSSAVSCGRGMDATDTPDDPTPNEGRRATRWRPPTALPYQLLAYARSGPYRCRGRARLPTRRCRPD